MRVDTCLANETYQAFELEVLVLFGINQDDQRKASADKFVAAEIFEMSSIGEIPSGFSRAAKGATEFRQELLDMPIEMALILLRFQS